MILVNKKKTTTVNYKYGGERIYQHVATSAAFALRDRTRFSVAYAQEWNYNSSSVISGRTFVLFGGLI
jgi:hypothetical protein